MTILTSPGQQRLLKFIRNVTKQQNGNKDIRKCTFLTMFLEGCLEDNDCLQHSFRHLSTLIHSVDQGLVHDQWELIVHNYIKEMPQAH